MRGAPLVSVVMPAWNAADFVQEAVRSILSQTLAELEVIVVDDGSTDRTEAIVKGLAGADRRVVTLRNDGNRGLLFSLNRGLEAARGRYVARQDADDTSRADRLDRQVRFLEANPSVVVMGSAFAQRDELGRDLGVTRMPELDTEIRWRLLFDNPFCHTSVMFRRIGVGGNAVRYESYYCEDYDLWARLLRVGQGHNTTEALVARRNHPQTYTILKKEQQARARIQIAGREIARVCPGLDLTEENVETLFRWYDTFPLILGSEQMRLAIRVLDLLAAFEVGRGVDRSLVRRIRLLWMRRILHGIPDYRFREALGIGLLRRLALRAPLRVAGDAVGRGIRYGRRRLRGQK